MPVIETSCNNVNRNKLIKLFRFMERRGLKFENINNK